MNYSLDDMSTGTGTIAEGMDGGTVGRWWWLGRNETGERRDEERADYKGEREEGNPNERDEVFAIDMK